MDDAPTETQRALLEPVRRLELFCSEMLEALATGVPDGACGSRLCAELTGSIDDGVRSLGERLRRESDVLDATVAQLEALSESRLFDRNRLADDLLVELADRRDFADRMMGVFERWEASTPIPLPKLENRFSLELADPDIGPSTTPRRTPTRSASEKSGIPADDSSPDALDEFDEPSVADQTDPRSLTALDYCKEAEIHRRSGDYARAESFFNEAIQLDPASRIAYAKRGLLYLLAGEYEAAIEDLTVAIELAGGDAELYSLRGDAEARAGRLERAAEDYRRALQLNESLHKTRFNLGIALRRLGEWSQGIEAFTQVLRVWPDHAAAYYNRGLLHIESGARRDAIADFETALRYKADYREAKDQLRTAARRDREEAEAVDLVSTMATPTPVIKPAPPPELENRVSVQCPGCGTLGLIKWDRLDKVVICQHCHRSFGVRPDGKSVEVIRTGEGRWLELQPTLARQAQSRRRWLLGTVATMGLIAAAGLTVWKVAKPAKQLAANELPKELNARAELFARAWLRNDVPLMRRLTSPTHEKVLFGWYKKHLPPIAHEVGIRTALPDGVKMEVGSKPTEEGAKVTIRIDGLLEMGGSSPSTELSLPFHELGDAWFFRPPTR